MGWSDRPGHGKRLRLSGSAATRPCVEPTTGAVLWSRTDVPSGCDLFGDEHYVLAVPHGSKRAYVYGMDDGRSFGRVVIPRWKEQLVTLGRKVISLACRGDGRQVLSSVRCLIGRGDLGVRL